MSVFRDMALDAGYRGDEADQVAVMLEQQEMERVAFERDQQVAYYAEMEAEYYAEQERAFAVEVWTAMPVHDRPISDTEPSEGSGG